MFVFEGTVRVPFQGGFKGDEKEPTTFVGFFCWFSLFRHMRMHSVAIVKISPVALDKARLTQGACAGDVAWPVALYILCRRSNLSYGLGAGKKVGLKMVDLLFLVGS